MVCSYGMLSHTLVMSQEMKQWFWAPKKAQWKEWVCVCVCLKSELREEIVDMWRVYVKLKNVEWWKTEAVTKKRNLVMDSVLLKLFSFIEYGTYDICSGPDFWWEFNGGEHFMIRLTIFGNLWKYTIYICSEHVFWCDYVFRFLSRALIYFSFWAYSNPLVCGMEVGCMDKVTSGMDSGCKTHTTPTSNTVRTWRVAEHTWCKWVSNKGTKGGMVEKWCGSGCVQVAVQHTCWLLHNNGNTDDNQLKRWVLVCEFVYEKGDIMDGLCDCCMT